MTRSTPLDAGFPLDDAWTHQSIARTFATTGVLGAVPERPLSAATSLLYPVLLSANYRVLEAPPSTFTALLNAAFYILAGQLFLLLLRRDGYEPWLAWAAAALAVLSGNFVWFAFSGMEASLAVLCLVALAFLWPAPRPNQSSALATGGAVALSFLVRPETLAMFGVLVISARACKRPLRHVVLAAIPVVVAVAGYAALTAGSGPSTTGGRRWMWLATSQGMDRATRLWGFLGRWADRLAEYVIGVGEPEAFWLLTGFAAAGLGFAVINRRSSLVALCALAIVHVLTYGALMPIEGHGGRYQPLCTLLFVPLVLLGAVETARRALDSAGTLSRRGERALVATLGFGLACPVVLSLLFWSHAHALAVKHIADTEVAMGRRLRELPQSARIATFDLGAIGFFSERPLLDLGALLDPSVLPQIMAGQTDALLEERGIDYVVVPLGYNPRFPDPWNFQYRLALGVSKRFTLSRVAEYTSAPLVWGPGLKATLHCSPSQHLYEILR